MNTILIIEDDKQIQRSLKELLELSNYSVLTANNGEEGLKLAQKHIPDLIISDLMMPKKDGFGVIYDLRENKKTATIPIILLTANIERISQRRGMEIGADDYITKPFSSQEILSAVKTRLKREGLYKQKIEESSQKVEKVTKELELKIQEIKETHQILEIKEDLLEQIINKLTDPVSNINMAIEMMKNNSEDQDKLNIYLQILKEECKKEIEILNEIVTLQELLQPENAALLYKFHFLKNKTN